MSILIIQRPVLNLFSSAGNFRGWYPNAPPPLPLPAYPSQVLRMGLVFEEKSQMMSVWSRCLLLSPSVVVCARVAGPRWQALIPIDSLMVRRWPGGGAGSRCWAIVYEVLEAQGCIHATLRLAELMIGFITLEFRWRHGTLLAWISHAIMYYLVLWPQLETRNLPNTHTHTRTDF